MDPQFDHDMQFILAEECDYPWNKSGQYSNLRNDAGGPTKFGIDARGYYARRLQTFGQIIGQAVTEEAYADLFAQNRNRPAIVNFISSLTVEDATNLYLSDYWSVHGCGQQPAGLDACYFNSWVNGGRPSKWIGECGGDWEKYLDLQEAYYRAISDERPSLRQFLSDWLARTARLKHFIQTGVALRP